MTAPATSAYVHDATETIQELVRMFKVRRLYEKDHPQRLEVEEQATGRVATLLDLHGTMEYGVEPDRIVALEADESVTVHRQEPGLESVPHLLHREGIRKIVLYSGLTLDELMKFMDNLVQASRSSDEDLDLVSRLWTEQFYHLRYFFVERLQDDEWIPPAAEGEEATEPIELAEEDVAAEVEGRVRMSDFDSTLYFLDDEDIAALQAQLEAEKERQLVYEGLTCLRELLMNPVDDDPAPVLGALAELHDRLLEDGAYDDVRILHELFEPYRESDQCDDRGRRAFRGMRERALAPQTLDLLSDGLESGMVDERTAGEYYRRFGRDAPGPLLQGTRDLKRLCQRRDLATVFVEIAAADHEALVGAIQSGDRAVASGAAFLAGLVTDPRTLEGLGYALSTDDAGLRRDAIQALKHFGGGRALELVTEAVDDEDPAVRLYALRHLVTHRYAPAMPRIERALDGDRWRRRPATEQRLLFEAYGALGGEAVVGSLIDRLKRRHGIFRKPDPEEMACVLIGLGATGAVSARETVEEATGSRHPLVSRVARQVLERWGETGFGVA